MKTVTKCPEVKTMKTADGVSTGMVKTLADSVALDAAGNVVAVPAGTMLSESNASGFDGRLNSNYDGRKMGDKQISYRA